MRAFAMMALAVAACGGGKDAAVCAREAHDLGELLSTMDHEAPMFYAGDATLVTRDDVPTTWWGFAPAIVIARDGATYEGAPFDSVDAAKRLAAKQAMARERASTGRDDAELVYLVIDEEARWADIVRIAEALRQIGFRRPALAFARPPAPVTEPPRSKIDDELDAIVESSDASNKATQLAKLMQRVIEGCPALVRSFGQVAADTGESKAETLIRGLEPALVTCRCNVDMPSLRSAMFRLLYVEKPQSSFRITLDRAGTAIELPPETPWREAQAKLSPDATVWFTVR